MLFDSHCHLQFNAFKIDQNEVIERCKKKGMVCNVVGTQKDTSRAAVEMSARHDFIYATIGLHPIHTTSSLIDEEEIHFKSREEIFDKEYYSQFLKSEKVIAVGECGIDLYHIPLGKTKNETLKKQADVFLAQSDFARENNLPLVIHVRDAHDEMIEILSSQKNICGVMHCYTSNWDFAGKYLEMGFLIGFTGVITFPPKKTDPKSQEELLEVVKNCPIEKILIETDAPYLAPQKFRGERSEPWMVEEVAKKIAEIKKIPLHEVILRTTENAQNLFFKKPRQNFA